MADLSFNRISADEMEKLADVGDILEMKSTGKYKRGPSSLPDVVRATVTDKKGEFHLDVLVPRADADQMKKGRDIEVEYTGTYVSPNNGNKYINADVIFTF